MARQVIVLQDENRNILSVEGSLKKIADKNGDQVLSYRQLQRLFKAAKDNGETSFTFKGKGQKRETYRISRWDI